MKPALCDALSDKTRTALGLRPPASFVCTYVYLCLISAVLQAWQLWDKGRSEMPALKLLSAEQLKAMCPAKQRLGEFKTMIDMIQAYAQHKKVTQEAAAQQLTYQQGVYGLSTLASVRSALKECAQVRTKWDQERELSALTAEAKEAKSKRKASEYQDRKAKKQAGGF